MAETVERDERGQFKLGHIGMGGRPKGARNKLGEAFIQALADDFEENGIAAIEVVRAEKPDQYLKVIASLLPKEMNLNVNNEIEMTDDELLDRIRDLTSAVAPILERVGKAHAGIGAAAGEALTSQLH